MISEDDLIFFMLFNIELYISYWTLFPALLFTRQVISTLITCLDSVRVLFV